MPKQVDHRQRREQIAHALWHVVGREGWGKTTMRAVAREADVSLGQVQHYFSSRTAMLSFAMDLAAERTSARVARATAELGEQPHPRDVLRIVVVEMLPLQPDARALSRMNAAFVLEALHDQELRERTREGMREGRAMVRQLVQQAVDDGYLSADRDAYIETDLLLALTGFSPLLDLQVVTPAAAFAAIDHHLDQLFASQ